MQKPAALAVMPGVALALFLATHAQGTVWISKLADPASVLGACTGVRNNANVR